MKSTKLKSAASVSDEKPISTARRDLLRQAVATGIAVAAAPLTACTTNTASNRGTLGVDARSELPDGITTAARDLRAGRYTCEELTKAYLASIADLQPKLSAFITITADSALAQARLLDQELRAGRDRGLLHGIPIVHKDLYDTKGIRTTVGSAYFKNRTPQEDATVVRRLTEAGVITLGKTNMNEFAAGITGTNEFFGDVHNPWNLARSPGGSSSGTGAAVAAGLCLGGTGSDTGGSIRVPCTWDNLTGIRPTYGRVSLSGVFPRCYSLDCGGPLARSSVDAAALLSAMAGYDPTYKQSVKSGAEDFGRNIGKGVRGLKLGIIENYTYRNVDPDVAKALETALRTFEAQGAKIVEVSIPYLSRPLEFSSLFTILLYEFNQILGDRFRAEKDKSLFGAIVHNDIAKGEKISEATYQRALADRAQQVREFKDGFNHADALMTPGMPTVAPVLATSGEAYNRGRQFTLPISWAGLPTVSAPCGVSADGMPIGMQIIGNSMQEALLLQIAGAYEAATDFYRRRPPVRSAATI